MNNKKLPAVLHVRWETVYEECLLAYENAVDAVEDDGPTLVGVYELVRQDKLSKKLEVEILRTTSHKSTSSNRK